MSYLSKKLSECALLTESYMKKRTEKLYEEPYYKGEAADALKALFDSLEYSLYAGGKRLRPFLVMQFCELLSGSAEPAVPYAAAIEMIHTFSLIHDDLPCMDDDDMRRGKPTNHVVFGEATALLAGDALSLFAFETLFSSGLSDQQNVLAAKLLAKSAGASGMIAGQQIDLYSEDREISEQLLTLLQQKKTGALFDCSCKLGCIAAGKTECDEEYVKAGEFASHIGLAFQITDDLLDVCGDEKALGKPVGSDEKNGKSTFVSLLGEDGARERAKKEIIAANDVLNSLSQDKERIKALTEMTDFILTRKN